MSKLSTLISVKKPTFPIFTPKIGISYSRYCLAEFNNVPSPPNTIMISTSFMNCSCLTAETNLCLYDEDSSINILTSQFDKEITILLRASSWKPWLFFLTKIPIFLNMIQIILLLKI